MEIRSRFAPEYVQHVLNENFEDAKALFLAPLMQIHYAHLVMLASTNIVSAADAHALRAALDGVSQTEVRGATFDGSCEDLFFYIERLIVEACGEDVAGRLHTARSRNDIDMALYRMRQRELDSGAVRRERRSARRAARPGRRGIARRSSRSTRTRSARSRRRSRTICWRSSNSSSATRRG